MNTESGPLKFMGPVYQPL